MVSDHHPAALMSNPHITVLAATDLVSGSRALYSIGVAIARHRHPARRRRPRRRAFLGGRIGSTIAWALRLGRRRGHRRIRLRHLRVHQAHHRPDRHHHRPIRSVSPAIFGGPLRTTESAQVFKGVHDTPTYTDVLFNKPMRLWVAIPLGFGPDRHPRGHRAAAGLRLCARHSRAADCCSPAPHRRRGRRRPPRASLLQFRLRSLCARRPAPIRHERHPSAAGRAREVIGNLQLHRARRLRPLSAGRAALLLAVHQRRLGVADSGTPSWPANCPPATIYGLSVPQDQRQLLRAMLHGHRNQPTWVTACATDGATLAAETPPHPHLSG